MNTIANTDYVLSWKSKGLSAESIKPPTTSDNSLTPEFNYYGPKTRVKFNGSCLKESKILYIHSTMVNIYIFMNFVHLALSIMILRLFIWTLQTLRNINILVMELDLIGDQVFHFQVADLIKMY